jgi:hypothetical protein
MIFKRDDLKLGIIIGLFGPLIGLVAIYLVRDDFRSISFGEYLDFVFSSSKLITSIGSLSLLTNVIFFTIYVNTRRDKTAKGIFAVTLLFGIAILVLKLLN